MSFELAGYYPTQEWQELRKTILIRDGYCCRNCGNPEQLQVHHWLPLPSFRAQVDARGYGKLKNPLIVHESGLITLTMCQLSSNGTSQA